MKKLKSIATMLFFFAFTTAFVGFETKETQTISEVKKLKWHTNFEEANALSIETKKPIFAFFTGSDWCGWCIALQKNVFAKPNFIDWANENVILLEIDFPRNTKQSEALKEQNYKLVKLFKVNAYPTIWIFNAETNPNTTDLKIKHIGKTGYPIDAVVGKEELKFIEDVNAILKRKR